MENTINKEIVANSKRIDPYHILSLEDKTPNDMEFGQRMRDYINEVKKINEILKSSESDS